MAEEGDAAMALQQQVFGQFAAGQVVVAADGDAGLYRKHRAPAHEVRTLLDQLVQAVRVIQVIAVAEQYDAVGLAAILVVGVPII